MMRRVCLFVHMFALVNCWKIQILRSLSTEYFHRNDILFLTNGQISGRESLYVHYNKILSSFWIPSAVKILKDLNNDPLSCDHKTPIIAVTNTSLFDGVDKLPINKSLKWLVFAEENDEIMANLSVPYDAKFVVAHKKADKVELKEWYKIAQKQNNMQRLGLGQWKPGQGLKIAKKWFIRRRINFQGAHFTYLITTFSPCSHLSFESWNVFLCIQHTIWNTIVKELNITAIPILSNSREPEYLVELFNKNLAQVSVNGWSITSMSSQVVSFMWPTFLTVLEGFTRVQGMAIGWDRYIQPFTGGIWMAVAGWIIICTLSVFVYRSVTNQTRDLPLSEDNICRREQIWTPLFAFLAQGCSEPTRTLKERLLILSALVASLVVIPAYSAALTSFLAIQHPTMPIMDLSDLLDHPEYKISSVQTLDITKFFQGTDTISQHILNHAILPLSEQPKDELVGARKMCAEEFTFVDAEVAIHALKPPCQYYKMRKPVVIFYQSLTLPKNSPYKHAFNTVIRNMELSGTLKALKRRTALKVTLPAIKEQEQPYLEQVSIEEVAVLLASLACAILLSLVILLCEILIHEKRKYRKVYPYLN